jgi:hypothetical protein
MSGPPPVERIEMLCRGFLEPAGVDGCGVSVMSTGGNQVTLFVSDDLSARIEELQLTLGEGPCVDAASAGTPVLVEDITDPAEGLDTRWPMFRTQLTEAGVRALFAFPIRIGAILLGTIDLHRRSAGPLAPPQLRHTLRSVDTLGEALLDGKTWTADNGDAVQHSMVVHQAAGMVMVQLDTRIDVAMVRLRATAFAEGRPIDALAAEVVSGRRRFSEEDS